MMAHCLILIIFVIPCCLAEIWTIYVHTGKQLHAGTDSNIYIRLFNSKDESTSEYQLTHANWIPTADDSFLHNLFEMGSVDRFRIQTEDIGSVAKIRVRQRDFPLLRPTWLLDQIVVESVHDGAKYTFKCNCWLKTQRPSETITALPDPNATHKDKASGRSSANNVTLVVILIILVTLLISALCCYNEFRRRRRRSPTFASESIDLNQQGSSDLRASGSRLPNPEGSVAMPESCFSSIRQWKNVWQGSAVYYPTQTNDNTNTTASRTAATLPDDPPRYEELYPNSNTVVNTTT